MDPFHTRLAHIALQAAGSYGFALAGGYAVQVHGFLSRMSSDVDLFTTASAEAHFASAVDAVIAASARYTGEELLRLAEDHDPGFDGLLFADALAAIDRLPDVLFQPYGLNSRDVDALKIRMNEWAGRIRTGRRG